MTRRYSDADPLALMPVEVGPNHFENPFKADVVANVVGAVELARRWSKLHWPECYSQTTEIDDPFEQMQSAIAMRRAGFQRADGPQGVGIFPITAVDETDWEQNAIIQAKASMRAVIIPRPKPEVGGIRRDLMVRGD